MLTSSTSKGMYCSASHWMLSASSSSLITGREIRLMMTECPDRAMAQSVDLMFLEEKQRWTASITRPESIIAPSTMASGESGSREAFTRWYPFPLPSSFSSTTLMLLEPMSNPTRFLFREKNTRSLLISKVCGAHPFALHGVLQLHGISIYVGL